MGQTVTAILVVIVILLCIPIVGSSLVYLVTERDRVLWPTLHRGLATLISQFAACLFVPVSKAVSFSFRSTSELPQSGVHRRRDLIGRSAPLHKYPGVIPNNNTRSERILNRYGRYLNVNARIPDTNATVFRVRSWLRNCEQNHNGQNDNPDCQTLDEDGRGYPLWLIDIEQRCVVPYQASLSYFALSYVWGQVERAKMARSNLIELQQPGSLLGPHEAVKLPKTIRDAMFLTGFLGHRYLWCDRLCLVQDDISSKLPQIQHMAELYARAYCTIIAFDNLDANSGLHGLPSLTRCSDRQISTSARMERMLWSSRAWTFQEELFSVRIIQLSSHTVRWQCSPFHGGKSTCGSNHYDPKSILSFRFRFDPYIKELSPFVKLGGMVCPRHASLRYYMGLAEEYSQRYVNEQHPEDVFHAFSSIQSFLKASYPGAFIQGIPECLIVPCLIWNTRASSHENFVDPVTGMRASSWSWMGWSARIHYPIRSLQYWGWNNCGGLVSWYVSLKRDSRRYPVFVAKEERWASYRKFEGRSSASMSPLNASSTNKQDMSLESKEFERIVPLPADSPTPSPLEVKNLCSFLHGRVLMAHFRVHSKKPLYAECVSVLSCETGGDYAGVLCGRSDLLEEGQVISLIAISEGWHETKQCCKRHRKPGLYPEDLVDPLADRGCLIPPDPDKKVYEFYDVLWVEYEDGVAYRKDIGRVRKELWDREALGWVDITLG